MKKLIRIPLILILVCCISFTFLATGVFASDAISVVPRFDIENSTLYIEGTVNSAKGNIPMVLTVKNPDGEIVMADQTISALSSDGAIRFSFEGIKFKSTTPSGDYEIYVSAAFVNEETTLTYSYNGSDNGFKLIEGVNKAVKAKNKNDLISVLEEYKAIVTNGDDTLFDLNTGKAVFAKYFMAKGEYDLPDGYESDDDIERITNSTRAIAANYKDSLCFAEASEISDKDDLQAWLNKYADSRGLFTDEADTDYDEAELKSFFDEAQSYSGLYNRISKAAAAATTFAELKDEIIKASVLEVLESSLPTKIQKITEENTDLIPVSIKKYNSLKATDKKNLYDDLTSLSFSSVDDYVKKFNGLVDDYLDKASSGSSSKKSSSGSGSSGSGTVTAIDTGKSINNNPNDNNAGTTDAADFTDLEDCQWVKPAVGYLTSKGVVTGKGANIFDPFTPVTRAEFTKMVTLAFGIEPASYDGTFYDVKSDDWFAPYVAAAYKAGVVNGVGEGMFDPYSQITRQDMAVLLYRAKGMSPLPEEKDVYYDSAYISDYAKSAVFALYFNGIALGYGDGNFGPLNNATRAEAAQMIYKMVTFDK